MGSKGPLFGIMGFGLLAAIGAAVLLAALKAGPRSAAATAVTTVPVLVAAVDVDAMTRLEESAVEVREVPRGEAPKERLGDASKVIGRVLKTGLLKGQPVTESALIDDQSGARLAMSLPEGFRAIAIELENASAMRGLLYPGSRVDVIVAYRARGVTTGPTPSRTLLQNVRVLAVEDKTVFTVEETPGEGEDAAAPPADTRSRNRSLMVTLMVDPDQARELQAARDAGQLSLSLRNPLDNVVRDDPVNSDAPDAAATPAPAPEAKPGTWQTVVIRGGRSTVETFERREGQLENTALREPARAQSPTGPDDDEQPADPTDE